MPTHNEEYEMLSKLFKDVQIESKDEVFKQKLFESKCEEMIKKGLISKEACDMGYKFMEMKMMIINMMKK